MQNKIIGIVGGGNMGEALIKGLYERYPLRVAQRGEKRSAYLKAKYKGIVVGDVTLMVQASIIIFAVKPQDMKLLLSQFPVDISKKLVISVAAGLTTKFFEEHLPGSVRIVRAMPNMPAIIGEGITGICPGAFAKPADLKTAQAILSPLGQVLTVKEDMMDALTAVSGSGPAYVFLFVESWLKAAIDLGFDQEQAKQLVYATLIGSAHVLNQSQLDAADLRLKVTSKGGTTQAAMDVFLKNNFELTIKQALIAAQRRAKELSS